ncbi:hypothetical protein Bca101_051125 [Brassica carinata]
MDDLQQATRMYTSCADPTENAARKQRVLVSDALGDMEVAPHRIINAAIETHAIQAQLLAQHMVLPPAIIPAPSELVSNVQDQRQSTTVTTGKKRGRPAKPKDKPKDMRIIPKTFVGPRPVAVFCQLFKHPWEQLLDLSKGEESPVLLLHHKEEPHLKHKLHRQHNFLLYHQQEMETDQETHWWIFVSLHPIFLSCT